MSPYDEDKFGQGTRPAAVCAKGWGWQHSGRAARAVHDLDLNIAPGERVLLLGPSGAGKSTLLHALAGVLGADQDAAESGSLTVDGENPAVRRGSAGLMQQDPEAQVVLSRIGDDVAFGAENLAVPRDKIWRRVGNALDAVGLDFPLDHPTSALSGGQKQRLGLAGILAMQPGLLLLDEPTANLDPAGVLEVRDAVLRMLERTGATMVVVEHRVAVWVDVVDRIVVLAPADRGQGGGVLIDGSPEHVLRQARRMLTDAGVWVPGYIPITRRRKDAPGSRPASQSASRNRTGADVLLDADQLAVSRRAMNAHKRRGAARRHPVAAMASGIDLTVSAGAALSITGPNGAGKSTLALTLGGLLPPLDGRLRAADALSRGAGPEPHRWKGGDLIQRIGTVFQEPEHQFVTGRVLDELNFGPKLLGRGFERVDELLERLRLTHLAEANPYTLSGGEKRRLSVATVLAANPSLLVLDEPTFGQDANTWAELVDLLTELLDAGTSVISVSHDEEFTQLLGGTRFPITAAGRPIPQETQPAAAHREAAQPVAAHFAAAQARAEVSGEH
ncbi:ABC transporter ATP-binding protein [Arthrobacter sp. H14-L1]|uniref:ABC transporter ATP-binding protein n=1 Tax=Arthrobacter sp. H14-L1 TaxID=2996697 RepID=UPI00226FE0D1|nr:ATP-binding cassette domain-containing protein [Arthrobacter sp. H14-L1]MCY0906508.1 ATP-binding cassette domain-containing protein [Arthrobacter sp. H14-L1]